MAATIRDVAQAAGVSPMAVSKVLHGRGASVRVSESTAERIRAAANELQYAPNRMARSLRGGKTRTIGLVFETIGPFGSGSRYYASLLDGIAGPCFAAGYALTLCPLIMRSPVAEYADGRFDGILWGRYKSDETLFRQIAALDIPVAMLHIPSGLLGDRPIIGVVSDPEPGIRAALDHLVGLGHRDIAFLYESSHGDNPETTERIEIFRRLAEERGFRAESAEFQAETGSGPATEWLAAHPWTTAVLLRSENTAGVVYEAAAKVGRRIPQDLSVIGFDSTEFCDLLNPPLTAISQPVFEMAACAVRSLIETIEGETTERRFVFTCGFDLRASTAPAPLERQNREYSGVPVKKRSSTATIGTEDDVH